MFPELQSCASQRKDSCMVEVSFLVLEGGGRQAVNWYANKWINKILTCDKCYNGNIQGELVDNNWVRHGQATFHWMSGKVTLGGGGICTETPRMRRCQSHKEHRKEHFGQKRYQVQRLLEWKTDLPLQRRKFTPGHKASWAVGRQGHRLIVEVLSDSRGAIRINSNAVAKN